MEAVGYIRVGTPEQAADGVSLDAQRARISAWSRANGYELIAVYVDAGVSVPRRAIDLASALPLAAATRTKAALVIYSLSRLARSTRDAIAISERFAQSGVELVSLSERIDTTTAAGKLTFRILAVLAEFERDIISERTKTALHHKRARGEYTGGVAPYGWRRSGLRLQPDARERAMAQRARRLRAAGLSLRGIGRRLAREGFSPRCGGRWHAKTVGALLAAHTRRCEAGCVASQPGTPATGRAA
jgi:site-specific DNA recombinase